MTIKEEPKRLEPETLAAIEADTDGEFAGRVFNRARRTIRRLLGHIAALEKELAEALSRKPPGKDE